MNLMVSDLQTVIVLLFGVICGGIPMFYWGKFIQRRNSKQNGN